MTTLTETARTIAALVAAGDSAAATAAADAIHRYGVSTVDTLVSRYTVEEMREAMAILPSGSEAFGLKTGLQSAIMRGMKKGSRRRARYYDGRDDAHLASREDEAFANALRDKIRDSHV